MTTVIAYTYEADYHCPDCGYARFGFKVVIGTAFDREGNNPAPVFSTDEWCNYEGGFQHCDLACGTCHQFLKSHDHGNILVQRDGSRGIFLSNIFVEDACDILGKKVPDNFEEIRLRSVTEEQVSIDGIERPLEGKPEELQWLIESLEQELAENGIDSEWDDGYIIGYSDGPAPAILAGR